MTRPPPRKAKSKALIKTTIRIAPDLHAELQAAAETNGRSMNAELLARIQESHVADLRREVAELKLMVREVLDLARDKL